MVSFRLDLLLELLLPLHHEFSDFLHVEVGHLHFRPIGANALDLVREEDGEFRAIHVIVAVLGVVVVVVLVDFLDELTLD